jgi:hypothetical protein
MNWYENLPPDCPPLEAFVPKEPYFRLGTIPPSDSDFWSHRHRFPHKVFHVSECVARSLSVFNDLEAAKRVKSLVPTLRNKPIFQVDLTEEDGLVQQTGNDIHHHSWWRSTVFDLSKIKISEQ